MAFAGPAMAAESMRNQVATAMTQGVVLKSALLFIVLMGVPKSGQAVPIELNNFRSDMGWGEASGEKFEQKILINRDTATQRAKGGLRARDFVEKNIVDTATFSYYTIEQTCGINEDDLRLNRDNKTRLVNIRKEETRMAEAAIHAQRVNVPHYATEVGHNAGVTVLSPTAVSGSTVLGTVPLDSQDDNDAYYWKPGAYDYGSLTLAADFIAIIESTIDQAEVSSTAGGLGMTSPDFGICDPDAYAKIMEFYQDKSTIMLQGGSRPSNYNLLSAGFRNIEIGTLTLIKDHQFGGSTGYIDGAAAEEVLVGNSKAMKFITCNTKKEGLIRALPVVKDDPRVSGELMCYKVDPFAFVITDPKQFALAYT